MKSNDMCWGHDRVHALTISDVTINYDDLLCSRLRLLRVVEQLDQELTAVNHARSPLDIPAFIASEILPFQPLCEWTVTPIVCATMFTSSCILKPLPCLADGQKRWDACNAFLVLAKPHDTMAMSFSSPTTTW